MTYTTKVTVPRVTVKDIENLKVLAGPLAEFVDAPVINHIHAAEVYGRDKLNRHLRRTSQSEFISGVQSHNYGDDNGKSTPRWEFTFIVDGD
jgi:hypothetical protein